MDELQRQAAAQADKLADEVDHLLAQADVLSGDATYEQAVTAAVQAKRVRRESNMAVRLFSALRDNLQP